VIKEMLSPAQENRKWSAVKFEGSLAIMTIVSGDYQWYLPLWFYCIQKELEGAVPIAYVRGALDPALPCKDLVTTNSELDPYPTDGYTTAALRFLHDDHKLRQYDYCLITDCDMLMMKEDPNLVNQHMRACCRYGLGCYHNYVSQWVEGQPRVPGVHFVTRHWWDRTAEARAAWAKDLQIRGAHSWEWDELMLGKIINQSGLTRPPEEPALWAHHGVHLGDYRRRLENKTPGRHPHAAHQEFIRRFLADPDFMALVDVCAPHLKLLYETINLFKTY